MNPIIAALVIIIIFLSAIICIIFMTLFTTETQPIQTTQTVRESESDPYEYSIDDRQMLPDYYLVGVDILADSYENKVKTLDDFDEWSQSIRDPPRSVYNANLYELSKVSVDGVVEFESYTQTKYTMPSQLDPETIIFYELKPNIDAVKFPTVVVFPGTGHQGARDLVDIESDASPYYYQDKMAVRLAEAGFLVYVPENRGYGERSIDMGKTCAIPRTTELHILTTCSADILSNQLSMIGINFQELMMRDHATMYRHILSLEYVGNIGTTGLSLGAGLAEALSSANEETVIATALISGTGSIAYSPPAAQTSGAGRLLHNDANDGASALAPRPLYISFGSQEAGIFGWEAKTSHTAEKLRGIYEMLGVQDNFTYVVHDGAHQFDPPTVIEFFNKHLR